MDRINQFASSVKKTTSSVINSLSRMTIKSRTPEEREALLKQFRGKSVDEAIEDMEKKYIASIINETVSMNSEGLNNSDNAFVHIQKPNSLDKNRDKSIEPLSKNFTEQQCLMNAENDVYSQDANSLNDNFDNDFVHVPVSTDLGGHTIIITTQEAAEAKRLNDDRIAKQKIAFEAKMKAQTNHGMFGVELADFKKEER